MFDDCSNCFLLVDLALLQSLNLGKIVTCDLNPLRVCQPTIVEYFAAITRNYQLAYCYTKIEQNSRNTLPTLYRDDKGFISLTDNVLEAFYPFDSYLLERFVLLLLFIEFFLIIHSLSDLVKKSIHIIVNLGRFIQI